MSKLFNDLLVNLTGYYDGLVEVLPKLVLSLIVFILFWSFAALFKRIFISRLGPKMDDPLLVQFLATATRYVIISAGILVVLKILGLGAIAGSILAGAGVGAFVIGFAFKDIGENFLAGIMMAFKRPFRINDTVELSGITGKVIALNLRDTQIKTFDGKDVFIPNGAVVKNPVVNFTIDGFIRSDFVIGVDYNSDLTKAIKTIENTLNAIDALEKDERKPFVAIDGFATSTVNLKVFYWIDTFDPKMPSTALKNMIYTNILNALTAEGFYMPASILEVKNYKDNVLKLENATKQGGAAKSSSKAL